MNKKKYTGISTVAIHAAHLQTAENAHLTPIFATSTFVFDSAEQGMDRFSGKKPGYIYSRLANPTTTAAEEVIAALESFNLKGEDGAPLKLKALLHTSGQSALATMLLSNLSAGDTILSHYSLYGGTYEFIYNLLPRMGIHTLMSQLNDLNVVEGIIKKTPSLKVIHIETPANPTMNCIDLKAICKLANKHHIKVTVDNTFATPYLQQPFKYGADFVFHSTTKFLNGHGTSVGGVLIGKDISLMKKDVFDTYKLLGANSSPFDAYLLLQGIKTLEVRMEKHCSNAEKVAKFLSTHSTIAKVNYNGLPSHPDHKISAKQMRHPGSVLSFELKDGFKAAKKFINKLEMCVRAVSLGTVDTLVSHPASMSHYGVPKEERMKAGITDGLIRMSVGIEDINDILNDLEQALKK